MPDLLFQGLQQYASRHQLRLAAQLGSGIHGLVHVALKQETLQECAVKAHHELQYYTSERDAYFRLRRANSHDIRGLNVPQLLNWDHDLRVIEMSIVRKPFLLDFAGATLDHRIEFPEEVWREWEKEKREQFGTRWPAVQQIISELEGFGIYLNDVSPRNIAWE